MSSTDTAPPIYDWEGFGFDTRQVHAGEYPDRNHGLRVPPIALSAGYLFDDFDDQVSRFNGSIHWRPGDADPSGLSPSEHRRGGAGAVRGQHEVLSPSEHAPIYSRQGNPSNWVAEERPRSWAPRQLVRLDTLPLLANGKPDRLRLRTHAEAAADG